MLPSGGSIKTDPSPTMLSPEISVPVSLFMETEMTARVPGSVHCAQRNSGRTTEFDDVSVFDQTIYANCVA